MLIDPLESRRLLTVTFSLDSATGVLRINGDGTDNVIVVRQSDTALAITDRGVPQGPIPSGKISSITIDAAGGRDTVTVESSVTVNGLILGGIGNDELRAMGSARWTMDGGPGADRMYGDRTTGAQTVDYSSRTGRVYVNLNYDNGDGEAGENDHVDPSIQYVALGNGDDYFHDCNDASRCPNRGENGVNGNAGSDVLIGTVGFDQLNGDDGNDVIAGGVGVNNRLEGGPGWDTIYGEGTNGNQINGGDDPDLIFGSPGVDIIIAGTGNDSVYAGDGNDTVVGEDGDDVLDGGFGNDNIVGGPGRDIADYGSRTTDLHLVIGLANASGAAGETDSINADVEIVFGGSGNDRMWIDSSAVGDFDVYGFAGSDTMYGGNGNDLLDGGNGMDFLYGRAGRDYLVGGADQDYLDGGADNDGIDSRGDGAADWVVGGSGDDDRAFADSIDSVGGVERVWF